MNLVNFTKTLIVCTKCGMSAKKLFYQTRINGYRQHKPTNIGYCEECKRYEIPLELIVHNVSDEVIEKAIRKADND